MSWWGYKGNQRRRSHSLFFLIASLLSIVALSGLLIWNYRTEQKQRAELIQYAQELREEKKELLERYHITLSQNNSMQLLAGMETEEVVTFEELYSSTEYISGYNADAAIVVELSEIWMPDEKECYMLVFCAYAKEHAAKILVSIDDTVSPYYITCQPNAFYLPIRSFHRMELTLTGEFQNLYIENMEIVKVNKENLTGYQNIRYGQYDLTEIERYQLDTEEKISSIPCRDVLTNGNYIYVLVRNGLNIYCRKTAGFAKIAELNGLGNTVHMTFVSESVIAVASRENDVFFIDINDSRNPYIVSTYDSLDLATGIEAYGDFLFVCSRYYGVEIIDISDISKPRLWSLVCTGGECIDCCVKDGYLYISNWNLKAVFVYDISNPGSPQEAAKIPTDGNPYGCLIVESNFVVATGHHAANHYEDTWQSGYGAGHGMEIYDISEPANPEWKSTVKADGRLYYPVIDSWGVYSCGNYVFLSSTYSGVYGYDISDADNPERIMKIEHDIPCSDGAYRFENDEKYIFSYNPNDYLVDPVSGIAFGDGMVYFAGQGTGLYSLPLQMEKAENKGSAEEVLSDKSRYFDFLQDVQVQGISSVVYTNEACVNSAASYGGYVYLACGDAGVEVITDKGEKVKTMKTGGSAQDIAFKNDTMYVAEGNYGIEVYTLQNDMDWILSFTYRCSLLCETVTQLEVSSDGSYLIAQDGWTRIKTFRILPSGNIRENEAIKTGVCYFRNLITTNSSSDYIGYASGSEIKAFKIKDGLGEAVAAKNSIYREYNGMCEIGGNIIAMYNGGYVIIPVDELNTADFQSYPVYSLEEASNLRGKISSDGSSIMVVSDAYGKRVTILDIRDIEAPSLITEFSTQGNPDVAEITDKKIYIPLKYQGLMIIDRDF